MPRKLMLGTGYRESIEGSSLKPLIARSETRIINDLEAHLQAKLKKLGLNRREVAGIR